MINLIGPKAISRNSMLRLMAFFILVVLKINCIYCQEKLNIQGYLRSQGSEEPIIGGTIVPIGGGKGTTTNNEGYFQLTTSKESVVVSSFGHQQDTLTTMKWKNPKVVMLSPYSLDAVEVKARRSENVHVPGKIKTSVEALRNVPSLLGEPDILRALTIFPGVSSGVEGTTGLHVQGGEADQNLMLLDGATIYNSGHVFGFLSVFNPEMISSAELYKGYIPPEFSGRLSSVLDVSTKSGKVDKVSKRLSLGLVNSSFVIEGPIDKKKMQSFMLGARMAHSFSFTALNNIFTEGEASTSILAGMYDVNAKYTRKHANGGQFSASFYLGDDLLRTTEQPDLIASVFRLAYGNKVASLKYVQPISTHWFSRTSLIASQYRSRLRLKNGRPDQLDRLDNINQISEQTARQEFLTSFQNGDLKIGIVGLLRQSSPVRIITKPFGGSEQENVGSNFSTGKISSYLDLSYRFGSVAMGCGLNASRYYELKSGYTFDALEPRLRINFFGADYWSINLGASRVYQDVHYLQGIGASVPYDIWLPASNGVPPQLSDNFTADVQVGLNSWTFTTGFFYRRMRALISSVSSGIPIFNIDPDNLNRELLNNGTGNAYGFEFFSQYNINRSNFTLSYTWLDSKRSFSEVNDGNAFPYRFERPHDLSIIWQYELPRDWSIATNFVLQTGVPVTLPTAYTFDLSGELVPVFNDRNNGRLPTYHRLDVMFSKKIRAGKKEKRLDLGFYNMYARANTSFATLRQDFIRESTFFFSPRVGESAFLLRGTVFRIIPTINYTVSW